LVRSLTLFEVVFTQIKRHSLKFISRYSHLNESRTEPYILTLKLPIEKLQQISISVDRSMGVVKTSH